MNEKTEVGGEKNIPVRTCKICGRKFLKRGYALYCSDECKKEAKKRQMAEYHKNHDKLNIRKCKICGKEFESIHGKRYCSEECRKKYASMYNSNYVRERRKTDPEFYERAKKASKRSSAMSYAKLRWGQYNEHTQKILRLATMDYAEDLITSYLHTNFQLRKTEDYTHKKGETKEELRAKELLESLGDII